MPVKINKNKINLSRLTEDLVGYIVTNKKGQHGIIIEQVGDDISVKAFDSKNITEKEKQIVEELKAKYDAEEVTIYIKPKFEPEYNLYVIGCGREEHQL